MKIIGYSERGAMNALFYGMALANYEKAMNEFIRLAGIGKTKRDDNEGPFSDFVIYSEFSLSEFGDPDMIVIAKDSNKDVLFFIEAKASCCDGYNLFTQQSHHDEYMVAGEKYKDGHSSNLFFQLRLKHYFIQRLMDKSLDKEKPADNPEWLTQSRGRNRKIGENVIVKNIVKEIQKCINDVYYIAIFPEQPSMESVDLNKYNFEIHPITWEKICDNEMFRKYLNDTIMFNQEREETGEECKKDGKNQILNNPQQFFK